MLPEFRVASIDGVSCEGTYTSSKMIGERWVACLRVAGNRFVWGRFVGVSERTATFVPDDPADIGNVQLGRTYPYLDGYWGKRAELVMNPAHIWQLREHPQDETWDHEHCEIDGEKIGRNGQARGYVNQDHAWVCERCYERFVARRSLDFIE